VCYLCVCAFCVGRFREKDIFSYGTIMLILLLIMCHDETYKLTCIICIYITQNTCNAKIPKCYYDNGHSLHDMPCHHHRIGRTRERRNLIFSKRKLEKVSHMEEPAVVIVGKGQVIQMVA